MLKLDWFGLRIYVILTWINKCKDFVSQECFKLCDIVLQALGFVDVIHIYLHT